MASIAVEWTDAHAPGKQLTATGTPSIPAHLMTRPPKGSNADLWSQVTATSLYNELLFTIETQQYIVVDIECQVVYADGLNTNFETIGRTVAAVTTGAGYAYLDNALPSGAVGSNQLTPNADFVIAYTS
jgi:hypothetical protein